MKLAIIEGDETHAELIRRYIRAWGKDRDIPLAIISFPGTENYIAMREEHRGIAVLFSDVRMDAEDRKETARRIRAYHSKMPIIYTADIAEEETDGTLHPSGPGDREKLFRCIDKALDKNEEKKFLTVEVKGSILEVAADKIMFVEARSHGCVIEFCPQRGRTFQLESAESISVLEERLDKSDFIRCHRSYIVRVDKIRRVGRDCIELRNGSRIAVSRKLYGELKQMAAQRANKAGEKNGQ